MRSASLEVERWPPSSYLPWSCGRWWPAGRAWCGVAGAVRRGCPGLSSYGRSANYTVRQSNFGVDSEPAHIVGGKSRAPRFPFRRQTQKPRFAGFCFRLRHRPVSTRPREYRGALATLLSSVCRVLVLTPPAFVGSPKQGARPSARLCDGVGSAGRPRAPSRAPQQPARSAADATTVADVERGFGLWPKLRGEPPAPPRFGKRKMLKHRVCRRSGGTGSGGTPDKCGGKL